MERLTWEKFLRDWNSVQEAFRESEDLVNLFKTAPRGFREQVEDCRDHRCVETREEEEVSLSHIVERDWGDICDQNADCPRDTDADAADR